MPYDTIIIGAGMAGITAAIYAARKRMNFEIMASEFGGQMLVSGEVLNYPGIVQTNGHDLRSTLEKQLEFNGARVKRETVSEIRKKGRNFIVVSDRGEYETQTVIIATGSVPRKLGVPGEERLAKKGVAYCAICDGPLFSGMNVAVIGGGNSAMEAAVFMNEIASRIYLVAKRARLEGHGYLVEKVKKNPKVEVIYNADTTEIMGEMFVSGIRYRQKGKFKEISVRGVIIEIGRVPNTGPFKKLLKMDGDNHIKVDCQGHTSVTGIFAAGDCASGHEYQYIISAGQGCMALLKAARYLADRKN
jgi:thioredoxin-disulfide reductase